MIVKVKEPLDTEYKYFRSDLNLFFFGGRFTIGNLKDKCPNLCKNKDKRCMDCVEYSMFEKKENEK